MYYQFGPFKFTPEGIEVRARHLRCSIHDALLYLTREHGQPQILGFSKEEYNAKS